MQSPVEYRIELADCQGYVCMHTVGYRSSWVLMGLETETNEVRSECENRGFKFLPLNLVPCDNLYFSKGFRSPRIC
jgi:hypothetical protein